MKSEMKEAQQEQQHHGNVLILKFQNFKSGCGTYLWPCFSQEDSDSKTESPPAAGRDTAAEASNETETLKQVTRVRSYMLHASCCCAYAACANKVNSLGAACVQMHTADTLMTPTHPMHKRMFNGRLSVIVW